MQGARQLGLVGPASDPTLDLLLPTFTALPIRPLTDEEELLCRLHASGSPTTTRRGAAWALGQATAVAGEQHQARIDDIDLARGQVRLRGNGNRDARIGRLTAWGVEQLGLHIEMLRSRGCGGDAFLIKGQGTTDRSGQAQSCNAVREVLDLAGLASESDVKPMSLPNWAGRRIFDRTGRIEEAAKALGFRKLDWAARAIGWEWR